MANIVCPICGNLLQTIREAQLKCYDCQHEFGMIWDEDAEREYLTNVTPIAPKTLLESWSRAVGEPGDYLFEVRRRQSVLTS